MESIPLGGEVGGVLRARTGDERYSREHVDAESLEGSPFLGRVRHQPNAGHPERAQQKRRSVVTACVLGQAEREVGVQRVEPGLLESVRPDLVRESDPAALLAQVNQDPALRLGDARRGQIELISAVAVEEPKISARETLGVNSSEDVTAADVARDERHVFAERVAREREHQAAHDAVPGR